MTERRPLSTTEWGQDWRRQHHLSKITGALGLLLLERQRAEKARAAVAEPADHAHV